MARLDRTLTMVFGYLLGIYCLYQGLTSPYVLNSWFVLICTLVYCHVVTDVATVIVHYFLDNYFREDQFFIGNVVYWFRKHHDDPFGLFERDFVDNNSSNSYLSIVPTLIAVPFLYKYEAIISQNWSLGPYFISFIYWQLFFFSISMSIITTVHKWCHFATYDLAHPKAAKNSPMLPTYVYYLQKWGIFVSEKHHQKHHQDPKGYYSLYAGWVDEFFEKICFFEALEATLYVLTGCCSVNTRLELRDEEQTAKTFSERLSAIEWKLFYSLLGYPCRSYGIDFHCMNWGYMALDSSNEEVKMLPQDGLTEKWVQDEYLQLQNYYNLVKDLDTGVGAFSNKVIADVSCGKGGGILYLTKLLKPAKSHGFDFTPSNIQLCEKLKNQYKEDKDIQERLTYDIQDACRMLKMGDQSVDIVLSVEASHCYPDMKQFFQNAHRVLKNGGHLLLTDFRSKEEYKNLKDLLAELNLFELQEETFTNKNIVRAMEKDFDRKNKIIDKFVESTWYLRLLRSVLVAFMASDKKSYTYVRLEDNSYHYFVWKLQKKL